MDYSKSGNPKNAKDSHHAQDLTRRGAPKDKTAADKKAALLDRMKAAAVGEGRLPQHRFGAAPIRQRHRLRLRYYTAA